MDKSFVNFNINVNNPELSFGWPLDEQSKSIYNNGFKPLIDAIIKDSPKLDTTLDNNFNTLFEDNMYRNVIIPSANGPAIIARKMPDRVWSVDECGFPQCDKDFLLSDRLSKGGLIIICGNPNNGKSTSCAAIIKERLEIHGGYCNTVEDPPEMPLQGFHGKGYCLQRPVNNQEGFTGALRDTLRAFPTGKNAMLLVGEVRDKTTASEALRAALNGCLVFVSFHAKDVLDGLSRILSLASDDLGQRESRALLGSSFKGIYHQQIIGNELLIESLYTNNAVRAALYNENKSITLIKDEFERQKKLKSLGQAKEIWKNTK
ncbi:ATPase, T2SS/T4P/T4SS family [Vibrio splendidus]